MPSPTRTIIRPHPRDNQLSPIPVDFDPDTLVWTSGDCPVCSPLNGTTYPDGWTTPPPLHHNCDCEIEVRPKVS